MAANNGPYYTPSRQANESSEPQNVFGEAPSIYPDLGLSTASSDQVYIPTDNAPQTDQTRSARHFVGLIRAAKAAASHEPTQSPPTTSLIGDVLCTTRDSKSMGMRRHTTKELRGNMATVPIYPDAAMQKTSSSFELLQRSGVPTGATQEGEANPTQNDTNLSALDQELRPGPALFRRTSSSTKKYTRPPMSKLFTSLELSPEGFFQLQAAAKAYMLDESYPDRRETVGQRGKGDSELVKLRLWTCVKDFLESEANGKRFFGRDVPGDDGVPRTMFWPTHKNNIITAVTPLLRRMVTNERQRQYAVETRRTGSSGTVYPTKRRKINYDEPRTLDTQISGERHPYHQRLTYHELFHKIYGVDPQEDIATVKHRNGSLFLQLDELSSQSGLSQPIFDGLVGIVDYHLRIVHGCQMHDDSRCSSSCEDKLIERILGTGYLDCDDYPEIQGVSSHGETQSYETSTLPSKQLTMQSSSFLLHELFRTVAKNAGKQTPHRSNNCQNPRLPNNAGLAGISSALSSPSTRSLDIVEPKGLVLERSITLHVNLMREGKRLHERLNIAATISTDIDAILEHVDVCAAARKVGAKLEAGKIMVMLPEGLVPVTEGDQWRAALVKARSNDWMDSELTILIELNT